MKYKLGCVLFGHEFLVKTVSKDERNWEKRFIDNCRKCGLTKKETGITS